MNNHDKIAWIVKWCLYSTSYYVLGVLGILLAIPPGYASPVFPAAGLAIAVALQGKQFWSSIWFGSLLLQLWIAQSHNHQDVTAIMAALGIASGSTLQAVTAVWLIKRFINKGWQSLADHRDIFIFLGLAGPVACLISATIANSLLFATHIISGAEFLSA